MHFRNNNYTTIALGKIFHTRLDAKGSWDKNWNPPFTTNHRDYHSIENIQILEEINKEPFINTPIGDGPIRIFKDEDVRRIHLIEVEEAAKRPGLSVHLHNTPWCQGPELGYPTRYDLGGSGTEDDPGIRWFFEHAHSLKE